MTEQVAELVSEAEYLSTTYEPDAEFVDGLIEERNLVEDDHSEWQAAITGFFGSRAVEWNIRVRPELRNKVADRRYRVPDVALLDGDVPKGIYVIDPESGTVSQFQAGELLRVDQVKCRERVIPVQEIAALVS